MCVFPDYYGIVASMPIRCVTRCEEESILLRGSRCLAISRPVTLDELRRECRHNRRVSTSDNGSRRTDLLKELLETVRFTCTLRA